MSDHVQYTQFDNSLDVEDSTLNPTNTLVTEDEELHCVEEGYGVDSKSNVLSMVHTIRGEAVENCKRGCADVTAKHINGDTDSNIKKYFPFLSRIPGDGGQHYMFTNGRPKAITDISQLDNQPYESFQCLLLFASEQMKQKEQECETLRKTLEEHKERLKDMKKELEEVYQQREAIVAKYKKELFELNQQSQNQREHISKLEMNRDELIIRLSKLAGDRLTHENMNIADLSDVDRPTKLSDVYSELYDNEWTDAFEELTSRFDLDEQVAIAQLLKILLTSFHRCRQITWQRYQTLKAVASTIDIVRIISPCIGMVDEEARLVSPEPGVNSEASEIQNSSNQSEAGPKEYLAGKLTFDQENQIKAIWRRTTNELKDESVKHLHIALLSEFGISNKEYSHTSKYLASCIDLCWKMGVQVKPMHLDTFAEKEEGGERIFDSEKFKAYTKTGKRVAFLVWPALLLHEGGSMLAKGIAQGCKETDNRHDSVYT